MAKRTQGTDLYALNKLTGAILDVGCVTSIDGIDEAIDQVETTCLRDRARTYVAGLATPGNATFGINVDPEEPAHVELYNYKQANTTLAWAVGFSESPLTPPTSALNSDGTYDFVPDPARSWILFEGYINAFPFTFNLNAVVQSNIGIQVSGDQALVPRVGS